MRLHCNTFGHWKDILICSMSCPYTERCKQFQKWQEEGDNKVQMWNRIMDYLRKHPNNAYELLLNPIASKKTREKVVKRYVCSRDDEIKILDEEEITQHLLDGVMFDEIFELGREMEVQIRLVPAGKTKKTKKTKNTEDTEDNNTKTEKENGVGKTSGRKRKSQASAE